MPSLGNAHQLRQRQPSAVDADGVGPRGAQARRRYPVEIALFRSHESTRAGSKPFCNSAMMGACPSAALAEAVTSVATLGGSSLRRCRAVLGTLYCFALAVNVRSVVGTFRLRLLLLVRCRLSGLGGLREERSEQGGSEHNDGHESAHRAHS